MYNLDLLKPDGSHYIAIGFSAPFCLHLPDGNYKVKVTSQERELIVQVILEKRQRNLSRGGLLPGIQEIEQFADRRGIYCFTSLIVYIPIRGITPTIHSNFDEMSKFVHENHPWANKLAVKAFNRLLEIYRLCTGECHIHPLSGRDVWMDYSVAFFYNEFPPDAGRSKFTAHVTPVYSLHNIMPSAPNVPDSVVKDIHKKLSGNFETELSDELLLNVYDFIDQGNYRVAIIESETAFEIAVQKFLHHYYHGRQREIDRLDRINSFTQLLHNDLFKIAMAPKKFSVGESTYENWNRYAWKVRGSLVHGKTLKISQEDALKAVRTIEESLEFLFDRPQTQPWRYIAPEKGIAE